ncbi:MAG TPA: GNAT family N-acetyltransferase [Opitutaceae bacterium]|jgi:GNAT superfamily N-acetyltransferase|nr:GNAT family N-acetyltransferase [Opitutaceae bacterium]HRE08115.1 GNAT family N-acetyltransferase [Opitutaceae bacterium]
MALTYRFDRALSVAEFTDVLVRSTLGERRPIDEPERLAAMLEHADLLCTAWAGDHLVGVSRSLTDFAYCCYLSDLAVDVAYQGQGVGTELIRLTQSRLHPRCKVILLAAPKAQDYYPRIGFAAHPSAWIAPAHPPLASRGAG